MNKLVVVAITIALTKGRDLEDLTKYHLGKRISKQLKHGRSARLDNISAEALKADFDSSVIIRFPLSKYVESKNNFKRMEREVSYQASYNRSS